MAVTAWWLALWLSLSGSTAAHATAGEAEPDAATVQELYHKAVTGDVDAQYQLFKMYRAGYGVERDIETAKRWLHAAGDNGHPEAQYWLGYIYFTGQAVERSVAKSLEWYERSAKQAYVPAEFFLGHLYNGRRYQFFERAPETAIYWYTRAAEHGNVQASLILGCKSYYGIDVDSDWETALKWFTLASMEGESSGYEYFNTRDETRLRELCDRVPRM